MCDFPAKQLLQVQREAARDADAASDPSSLRAHCDVVLKIQELRLAHEEATACRCWFKAVEDENV